MKLYVPASGTFLAVAETRRICQEIPSASSQVSTRLLRSARAFDAGSSTAGLLNSARRPSR